MEKRTYDFGELRPLNAGEVVKNALRCGVCGASADRHPHMFICQGDLTVGIFSDLTYPDTSKNRKKPG